MNADALKSLRDIHLPPEPLWWQTAECWMAAGVIVVVLGWAAYRFATRRRLRAALNEVALLHAAYRVNGDAVALARGLSGLLRIYAVARFPDAGVEGLAGSTWLQFLDAHGGKGEFMNGVGATLERLPYQAAGAVDADALTALVCAWLQEHPR